MNRLFQFFILALFFVLVSTSWGAGVKVLPLNAPNLPNEKLYSTITNQILNAVQDAGYSVIENADYALRISVLNPKGSLVVGAEVRGVQSFYKKDAVNVGNVSMLEEGIRQVVSAVLNEIPVASDADDVGEIPSEESLVRTDTIIKKDTITKVDTIARIDTVMVVDTVARLDTIVVVDTLVSDDGIAPKKSFHYVMLGLSFANSFFLREHTMRYKAAVYKNSYSYNVYDTERTYTAVEQNASVQVSLGYAYESPMVARLSKVFSANLEFGDSDGFLAFAGGLKLDLLEKRTSRKTNPFIQGGLGPVIAYIGSFTDDEDYDADFEDNVSNAIESLGDQIDESVHFGMAFDIALGIDFLMKNKSKFELAVKIEQVWLDFLGKLSGNRIFVITPYVALGF